MKTITEARKEYYAVQRAWFDKYEQQVAQRLAELLPDIKCVLRFGCWPDDGTPCYEVYFEDDSRDRSRKVIEASATIEDELRKEFPECNTRGIDIKYMPS